MQLDQIQTVRDTFQSILRADYISISDIKQLENLNDYYELLCIMMSNKNLYTRKKKLIELLEVCKNTDIYKYIFKFGSTELLSGLFLESAKREIKDFIDEAQFIHKENIHYSEISYVQGLKRCAEIYLNSVNKEKRREREKWIKDNICNIDLNIIRMITKIAATDAIFTF